jgi:hypothetical protein
MDACSNKCFLAVSDATSLGCTTWSIVFWVKINDYALSGIGIAADGIAVLVKPSKGWKLASDFKCIHNV